MKKVSQKDIAESLNVSRVTVTKALQDHPDIVLKTRERIQERAAEMGYIPDFIGRSLSSKRTQTIGIILPKIAHSFFAWSIESFYKEAKKRGYHIIPMISFEDQENELDNIKTLLSMRVDGIIIDVAGNCEENTNYEIAKRTGCKVLFYDRFPTNSRDAAIVTNDREIASELTKLLINKGCKKIFHFAGPYSLNISMERQRGYEEAMSEHKLMKYIYSVDMNKESGYEAMMKLAKNNEVPEAIFTVNDSVAHGVYKAAKELGLNIPGDIAVAGFGDVTISYLLDPPMTTVRIPVEEMTKAALDTLIDMIENDKESKKKISFPSEIIERESTNKTKL